MSKLFQCALTLLFTVLIMATAQARTIVYVSHAD